jgi:uncharacterized membrane protein
MAPIPLAESWIRQLDLRGDTKMARLVFFGSVLALIILILIWEHTTIGARVAKAASITYLVLAVILLIVSLTVQWE